MGVAGRGGHAGEHHRPGRGGCYRRTYNGDARNAPAGPTPCDDPNAAYGFGSSSYAFHAQASAPVAVGGTVSDTATITTSSNPGPTGTMGPCSAPAPDVHGTARVHVVAARAGQWQLHLRPLRPQRPRTYRWVAFYSGDADDPAATTTCADPSQQVEVRAADASSPGNQCTVRARPLGALAALRQMLQELGDNPLAALLRRLGGLTACGAALPAG